VTYVTRSWPSIAVVAAGLVLALAPAAHGAFTGRNGFIAYVHNASGSQEEGEGPTSSTNALMVGRLFDQERFTLRTCTRVDGVPQEPACDTSYDSPAYSPTGDHLLVDAGDRIAILESDGSDFRLLPQQTANDGAPAWAPDGERFVFTGVAEGASEPDLYVYNLARDRSRRLTTTGGTAPAWSSRNRIVYVSGGRLALIDPDGSRRRLLTRKNGLAPNWSPHGTKIAFVRKGRLYLIGADGSGPRRVGGRRTSFEAEDVTWSPDGRFLAYHDFEGGIMVVDPTGRREYEFELSQYSVGGSFDAYMPDWQPLPPRPRR
jgi:hypothetical protein